MAKAVVLNLPEHGHMNTTYPMVAELVRRGQDITYFASEPFRARVESTGARFASYGEAKRFHPPAHVGGLHSVMAWEMALAEELLPRLIEEVAVLAPDYLLIDSMCVWGALLQQILRIPAVCIASVFVPNDRCISVDAMIHAAYGQAPKELLLAGIDALNSYIEISRRIDHRFGTLSPNIVEFFSNRQTLNIVFTSREFHPAGETYDESYKFVGPVLNPRPDSSADSWILPGSAPLIYVSLGTIFNDRPSVFQACIEAFGGKQFRVVIAAGDRALSSVNSAELPDNIKVLASVPQLEVLKRTALFITHGGMNSVSEALAYGVPLMVLPQHGDQYLVAERVTTLGAGLCLNEGDTVPEKLFMLANKVLQDSTFSAGARAIANSFVQLEGAKGAADAIGSFASEIEQRAITKGAEA